MPKKKDLMTGDVKEFIAEMNPKREAKRKSPSHCRSVKNHHAIRA